MLQPSKSPEFFRMVLPGFFVLRTEQYRILIDRTLNGTTPDAITVKQIIEADKIKLIEDLIEDFCQFASSGSLSAYELRDQITELLQPGNVIFPEATLINEEGFKKLLAHELYHSHTIRKTAGSAEALCKSCNAKFQELKDGLESNGSLKIHFSGTIYDSNSISSDIFEVLIHAHEATEKTEDALKAVFFRDFTKDVFEVINKISPEVLQLSKELYQLCKRQAGSLYFSFISVIDSARKSIVNSQHGASLGLSDAIIPRIHDDLIGVVELRSPNFTDILNAAYSAGYDIDDTSLRRPPFCGPFSIRKYTPTQTLCHISPNGERVSLVISEGDRDPITKAISIMIGTGGRTMIQYTPETMLNVGTALCDTGSFSNIESNSVTFYKSNNSIVTMAGFQGYEEKVAVKVELLPIGRFSNQFELKSAKVILRDGAKLTFDENHRLFDERLKLFDTPTFTPDGREVFILSQLKNGEIVLINYIWDADENKFHSPQVITGLEKYGQFVCSPAIRRDGKVLICLLKDDEGLFSLVKLPRG